MTALFDALLSISINSLWVIGAVLLVRALLTNRAKSMRMLLWALVALRLVIPFTLESDLSLIPEQTVIDLVADEAEAQPELSVTPDITPGTQTVPNVQNNSDIVINDQPDVNEPVQQVPIVQGTPNDQPVLSQREPEVDNASADDSEGLNDTMSFKEIAVIVWLAGIALLMCYHIVAHITLRLKLRDAYRVNGNIWRSDRIPGAFSYGVIKPKIYIPTFINGEEEEYILAHERAHISHGDHLFKLLAIALSCVYWYNPAVWVCYYLFCRDMEYSCDERLITRLDDKGVKEYLKLLVKYSAGKRVLMGPLLAFNSNPVKKRVENMINYKKPALWTMITCATLAIIIVVCFMTVPSIGDGFNNENTQSSENSIGVEQNDSVWYLAEEINSSGQVVKYTYDDNGKISNYSVYQGDELTISKTYEYDELGREIRVKDSRLGQRKRRIFSFIEYTYEGTNTTYSKLVESDGFMHIKEFDDYDRVIYEEFLDDGEVTLRRTFEYLDDNGSYLEYAADGKPTCKTLYDDNGNVIHKIMYGTDGQEMDRTYYEYDDHDELIKVSTEDKVIWSAVTEYDDAGLLTSLTKYDGNGDLYVEGYSKIVYTYDEYGNKVKEECFNAKNKSLGYNEFVYTLTPVLSEN